MVENKKVKNAKEHIYDNIKFRSGLEVSCYKKLQESTLEFEYESEKVLLWEGIKCDKVKFYCPNKIKLLEPKPTKLIAITYTPDFKVVKDNYIIYFDVKGFQNDTYPIKRKMFLKHLEMRNDNHSYLFIEPHTVKQIIQAIELIKSL